MTQFTEDAPSLNTQEVPDIPDFLRVDEFSLLGIERYAEYKGTGAKSWAADHDPQKATFLESIGIELPDWIKEEGTEEMHIVDREALITMFIVTNHILAVHDAILDGESLEETEFYLEGLNRNFYETRVDHSRLRKVTTSGKRMQDYVRGRGGSANVHCKVSEDDLYHIVSHIFNQLRRPSQEMVQNPLIS